MTAPHPSPADTAFPWADSQQAFADAAGAFVRAVGSVGDRWSAPGLGEWDVRALVGHTSRSLLTVEEYLGRPAAAVEVGSAAGYVRATRVMAAGPGVADRGRQAGTALGADPAAAVAGLAARVLPLVAAADGGQLLTTVAGGMRLADYLPTRTLELVVHTADLATALGRPAQLPPAAARQALAVVADLAVDGEQAAPLLLAATGRAGLPAGFSVL
ncbi:maleylpyruvate isomerase family mycothiol-dependent enzyme [Blastococcus sp. SYSU D00820]